MNLENLAAELSKKYDNKGITFNLIARLLEKVFQGRPWQPLAAEEELDADLERIARFLVEWYADSDAVRRANLGKVIIGYVRDYKIRETSGSSLPPRDSGFQDRKSASELVLDFPDQKVQDGRADQKTEKGAVREKTQPVKAKRSGRGKKIASIAVIGVPHSGKTAYLYVLGKHLQKGCFGKGWRYRIAGPEYQQFLVEQEENLDQWEKADPASLPWRLPLFSLRRRIGLTGTGRIGIECFDAAGELLPDLFGPKPKSAASQKERQQSLESIRNCDGFLFLLDSAIFDRHGDCTTPARQKEWRAMLNGFIRAVTGENKLDRPVAVVFNKADLFDGNPPAENREPRFELQDVISTVLSNRSHRNGTSGKRNNIDAVLEETRKTRCRAARDFARKCLPLVYEDLRASVANIEFFAISCWGRQPQFENDQVSIVRPECPIAIYEPLGWLVDKVSERIQARRGARTFRKGAFLFLFILALLVGHFALGVHAISYLCGKDYERVADVLFLTAEKNPLNYLSFGWFRPSFEKAACVLATTHHKRVVRGEALQFSDLKIARKPLFRACRAALRGGRAGEILLTEYLSEDAQDELKKTEKTGRISVSESLEWFGEAMRIIRKANMFDQEVASLLLDVKRQQVMYFLEKEKTGVDLLDGTILSCREEGVPADLIDDFRLKVAREIRTWCETEEVRRDPRKVQAALASLPPRLYEPPEAKAETKAIFADQTMKAHLSLAKLLIAEGKYEEATKEFTTADQVRPDADVFKEAVAAFCQAADACRSNKNYKGLVGARNQAWLSAVKNPSSQDEVRNKMLKIGENLAKDLQIDEAVGHFRWCMDTAGMNSAQGSAVSTFIGVLRDAAKLPPDSPNTGIIREKLVAAAREFDTTGSRRGEIDELERGKEGVKPEIAESSKTTGSVAVPAPGTPSPSPAPTPTPGSEESIRAVFEAAITEIEKGNWEDPEKEIARRQQKVGGLPADCSHRAYNVFQNLSEDYLRKGNLDNAQKVLDLAKKYGPEESSTINKTQVTIYRNKAENFLREGKPDEAQKILEEARRFFPKEEALQNLTVHASMLCKMKFVRAGNPSQGGFYLDPYEVSTEEYVQWADKQSPKRSPVGYGTQVYVECSPSLSGPVVRITWEDANDYAEAMYKRLPKEEEWMAAMKFRYPWGDEYNPKNDAVVSENGHRRAVGKPMGNEVSDIVYSSRDDVTTFGVRNLLGNVEEWVADPGPDDADSRIIKGSSWRHEGKWGEREKKTLSKKNKVFDYVGFRCAADPLPPKAAAPVTPDSAR